MHNQIHLVPAGVANALMRGEISAITQSYQRYREGWQLRATYLTEQLALHPAGSDAHDLAETRLAELRSEIAVSREYLVAETSRLPSDDLVDAILDELDELLATVSGAATRSS